ncbi:Pr6Pr family membrane protein [Nonomuraea sp. NPDC050547]|uniref:Pr6Pr family membrane protein n=1 Tax=Nonomuraea sp. NPDC050547 TaxID=3364368 RepID=UPI00379DD79C
MRTLWRILLVAAALTGVALALVELRDPWVTFTVQSNTVLAAYYLWLLAARREGGPSVRGAVTLYLVVTGVVAFFALPLPQSARNLLLHGVTPLMVLVDWTAFTHTRRPGWADPFKWLAFPLGYAVLVLLTAPDLPVRMARRHLRLTEIGFFDYVLAGLGFSAVFLTAGYALIALTHISTTPGKGAQKGRSHHAGKDDRIPRSP